MPNPFHRFPWYHRASGMYWAQNDAGQVVVLRKVGGCWGNTLPFAKAVKGDGIDKVTDWVDTCDHVDDDIATRHEHFTRTVWMLFAVGLRTVSGGNVSGGYTEPDYEDEGDPQFIGLTKRECVEWFNRD